MNKSIVDIAFDLFVETLPLADMPLNDSTAFVWHDLYSKECKLYSCFSKMSKKESEEYRKRVASLENSSYL